MAAIAATAMFALYMQMVLAIVMLLVYALVLLAIVFERPMLMVPYLCLNFVMLLAYGFKYLVSVVVILADIVASWTYERRFYRHGELPMAATRRGWWRGEAKR